jgi:alkanesulfonate monooxygenase SsuD/methylene tetrahydromethanopterin reductase-like flavin-dependent oxidoreductase (luciferase family)
MAFRSVQQTGAQFARVRDALAEAGRDESSMVWSAAQTLCCGRDDAEVRRRAEAIGQDADELRANRIAGTPAECVDRIGQFADLGVTRIYLQTLDVDDLDHLELVAAEVAPQL